MALKIRPKEKGHFMTKYRRDIPIKYDVIPNSGGYFANILDTGIRRL